MSDFVILPLLLTNEDESDIDIEKVRKICSYGLDECPNEDRTLAWLLLSGVHPKNSINWPKIRVLLVNDYINFIKQFNLIDYEKKIIENTNEITEFGLKDDNKLMEMIHGDIIRTAHHIPFFPFPNRSSNLNLIDPLVPFQEHMRRIERILFIFAKLNCTLSYLQGFNELICPIFFVIMSSCSYFGNNNDSVEAFSFYVFQNLLSTTNLQEMFTTQDSSIIHRRLFLFMDILNKHLPNQANIINSFNIHPLTFAYPWLNLLFAQAHLMPNLILIWDSLFAHFNNLLEYAAYICVATIKMMEKGIIEDDYIITMTTLKKFQIDDVKTLLNLANNYWEKDHTLKKNFNFLDLFN